MVFDFIFLFWEVFLSEIKVTFFDICSEESCRQGREKGGVLDGI